MVETEDLLTLDGKIEEIFAVLKQESTASDYAEFDYSSVHFVNEFRNYLKDVAGSKETLTNALLPKVNHRHALYVHDANIQNARAMRGFSGLIGLLGGYLTLAVAYTLMERYKQVSKEPNASDFVLLGIGVSLAVIGFVNYYRESKQLKKHLKIKEKVGNPFTNENAKQLWGEAVEEIYKNKEYRKRALSLVGNQASLQAE